MNAALVTTKVKKFHLKLTNVTWFGGFSPLWQNSLTIYQKLYSALGKNFEPILLFVMLLGIFSRAI